jgi:asparagine synthase (glutamine-hydrolysing)
LFLSNVQKRELYTPDFFENSFVNNLSVREPFKEYFKQADIFEGINKDLYLDFKTYMVDNILVKVDRMSMATSLEARVPLLDKKIVEFAFSLPSDYKLKGKTTKWFFKKTMENILPKEIIYRRKEGFSIPIKNWLKTDLKELMMEYLSPKRIKDAGILNQKYVDKLINQHLTNKENHAHRLWSFILFNIWMEKFGV